MADETKQDLIDKWVAKGYSPKLAAQIVADVDEIHARAVETAAPAAPAIAPAIDIGTAVQVQSFETAVLERTTSRTPEQTPNVLHWIYARVAEIISEDGVLVVIVDHPGNVEHGVKKVVEPGEYRTAADVQAELDSLPSNPGNDRVKDLRRSLTVQLNRLQPPTLTRGNRRRAQQAQNS